MLGAALGCHLPPSAQFGVCQPDLPAPVWPPASTIRAEHLSKELLAQSSSRAERSMGGGDSSKHIVP